MAANTYTGQLLVDYLSDAGPLNADDALLVMQSLVAQAATLHDAGRLHGAILSSNVTIDDRRRPTLLLREPAETISNDGAGHWPPELSDFVGKSLPTDIARVRDELQRSGVPIDPRRIDVFQLGRLACELVSGHAADSYLFSPRGKAHVPVAWRPFIDGLLGYDSSVRFSTCEQAQSALQAVAKSLAASNERAAGGSQETPPRGTGVDVTQNTPLAPHRAASPPALPFAALGHYRIDARLGSGGMGDVYRGYEPALDRTVAIKVLPAALARQADFVTRFVDEAKAAARLVHLNIVQIYFIGEDAGHHYFSMQYVEGESLADRLKRERRIPLDDALAIVEQIVAGLSVAHRHGMIHRDIKPANILLDAQHDRALLADFGLVKSLDNSAGMTATGMVMGTVDYISPEQGRGLAVDGRSDLYSIGVLLYQMLSGRLPFDAESATAMIFQHAYERPRPLEDVAPDVPRGAGAIVHRLMAKDPGKRYPTAEALLADVSALRASHGFLPPSVEESESRETSVIIAAPRFDMADDERRLSAALVPLPALRWKDRLRAAFEEHAPDALKGLQNTEQQVDGALALYQSRRDQHALLAREACAVEKELAAQVDALKRAATQSSGEEQRQNHQTADSLAARLAEQRGEREQIELRLAKIDATLQKLRSQHALLQARMRVVAAGHVAAEGGAPRRHRRRAPMAVASLAIFVPAAVFLMWLPGDTNLPPPPMPVAVESPSPMHPYIHPSDGWVNLLSMVDIPRDALSGRWLKTAAGLKIDNPSGAKGLRIPLSLNGSYELRVRFTRSRGGAPNRGVSVSLPVDSRHAVLVLGQAAGNGVGLGGVNGLAAFDRDNPANDRDVPIPPDVEHELTVVVEHHASEAHLLVSVDGRQVMDWRGSAAALRESKDRESKPQPPQLVLAAWANDVVFHAVELRMIDGAAAVKGDRRPLPAERNLLAPQAGTWQINFLSDAQRGVTMVAMPEGRLLLKGSGALAGLYRWDGDRLVMEEPHDKRYQRLVWKWRDDALVLIEEPASRPSGSSYVGASMKFVSDDTTEAARASVPTRPSRIKPSSAPP